MCMYICINNSLYTNIGIYKYINVCFLLGFKFDFGDVDDNDDAMPSPLSTAPRHRDAQYNSKEFQHNR